MHGASARRARVPGAASRAQDQSASGFRVGTRAARLGGLDGCPLRLRDGALVITRSGGVARCSAAAWRRVLRADIPNPIRPAGRPPTPPPRLAGPSSGCLRDCVPTCSLRRLQGSALGAVARSVRRVHVPIRGACVASGADAVVLSLCRPRGAGPRVSTPAAAASSRARR